MTDELHAFPPTVKPFEIAALALKEGQFYTPADGVVVQIWDQLCNRWRKVTHIQYSYNARSGDREYIVQHGSGGISIPVFDQRYANRFPLRTIDDPDYEYLTTRDLTFYPVDRYAPSRLLQYWTVAYQIWVNVISVTFGSSIKIEFRSMPPDQESGVSITHRQFESQMLFRKEAVLVTK